MLLLAIDAPGPRDSKLLSLLASAGIKIVKRVIDTCVVILTTCDHVRRVAPRFCLATGQAQPAPFFTPTTTTLPPVGQCDQQHGATLSSLVLERA